MDIDQHEQQAVHPHNIKQYTHTSSSTPTHHQAVHPHIKQYTQTTASPILLVTIILQLSCDAHPCSLHQVMDGYGDSVGCMDGYRDSVGCMDGYRDLVGCRCAWKCVYEQLNVGDERKTVRTPSSKHTHTRAQICTDRQTYTHRLEYTYTSTYTHTHPHIHTPSPPYHPPLAIPEYVLSPRQLLLSLHVLPVASLPSTPATYEYRNVHT